MSIQKQKEREGNELVELKLKKRSYEEELEDSFEKIRNIIKIMTEMREKSEQESKPEIIEVINKSPRSNEVNHCFEKYYITPDEEEDILILESPPHNSPPLASMLASVPRPRQKAKKSVTGYKQYTRRDILAALEEVRKGRSALQVSKQFNIPSRTLYDKARKMGITSGRSRRNRRKEVHNQAFQDHKQALFQQILSEHDVEDIVKTPT